MDRVKKYYTWTTDNLYQLYGKPSDKKIMAYDRVISRMLYDKGYRLRLSRNNTWSFSAGYLFKRDGVEYLKYFTSNNVYVIKV